MSHQRRGRGHRLGGGGDLGVGHAQHDGVAAGGALAAPDGPLDGHTRLAKRARERGPDPAGTDYSHPQGAFEACVI